MTDSELWKALREDRQARRAVRRENGTHELEGLEGYEVRKLTEFHFRINNAVDVYPTSRRYHVLGTNRRGSYGREPLVAVLARVLRRPA